MEPWTPLQPTRLEQKGFRGMRDVVSAGADSADLPLIVHNMSPLDAINGGPLVTRPPWRNPGSANSTPAGTCQLIYGYDKLDSSYVLVGIFGGAIYSFGGSVWSTYISAGTLSGAGITLSTTAQCYAVNVGGKMVVSDGVNTPFMYDGVTATITKLTDCPVLYGQPTVYYAKLVGIKASERSTFVWSEENDPTIGYEAGGFNNTWTLGQTGAEPLQVMLGTNRGLFYWRRHSMGVISGAVTTDFVNDGVHDGVSGTVGTAQPKVLLVDETIYWTDASTRPYCLTIGGDIQELYLQMQRKFDHQLIDKYIYASSGNTYGDGWKPNDDAPSVVRVLYDATLRLVLFGLSVDRGFTETGEYNADNISVVDVSASQIAYFACYSHDTKTLQAYWTFPRIANAGAVHVASAKLPGGVIVETFVHVYLSGVGTGILLCSKHTGTWRGSPDEYALDEGLSSTQKTVIPQFVIGPQQGHSDDVTVAFDRLDVSVGARPMVNNLGDGRTYEGMLGVALQTSNHQVSEELSTPIFSGDAALFPAGGTDQVQTAGVIRETQNSFGLAEEGRWARVLLRLVGSSSSKHGSAYPLAIYGWTLTAMARTRAPATNIAPP